MVFIQPSESEPAALKIPDLFDSHRSGLVFRSQGDRIKGRIGQPVGASFIDISGARRAILEGGGTPNFIACGRKYILTRRGES
jgi:hypothetical protein